MYLRLFYIQRAWSNQTVSHTPKLWSPQPGVKPWSSADQQCGRSQSPGFLVSKADDCTCLRAVGGGGCCPSCQVQSVQDGHGRSRGSCAHRP